LSAQATERDSAGVRIVSQPPGARVKLGSAVLRLDGTESGHDPFFRLDGNSITAHAAGLVVANAATELRFYSPAGELRKMVGGRGGGPGEFQFISWVQRIPGDSIEAYDGRLRRVSVWTRDGERGRETLVPGAMSPPAPGALAAFPAVPAGALADGVLLFTSSVSLFPNPSGIARARGWLLRGAPAGSTRDTIAPIAVIDYGPSVPSGAAGPAQPVAFMRMLRKAVTAEAFAITEGDAYRIEQFDPAGRRTSIRVQRALQNVSAPERDAWKEEQKSVEPIFPLVFPAYGSLFRDVAGRLWAELYPIPNAPSKLWDVFDARGRLLATVEVPTALELVTGDATRVYGIHTDELNVQTIQAFEVPAVLRR